MDELIEELVERGFPMVRVHFPRSYIDVNREPYELDPRMFTGKAAELRQHPLDAGRRRTRHHPAGGRRRPGNLSRAHQHRRRARADRDAVQALPPRAAPTDQPGAGDVRHGDRGRLPFDAVGRSVARRAAAARRRDRRSLRHELPAADCRCGRADHDRRAAIRSAATSPMPAASSPSITAARRSDCTRCRSSSIARSTWTSGSAGAASGSAR